MDSLTQIILGAAVGEAVLGKKIGNRAVLYGGIIGTIPDLDVLVGNFVDPLTAIEIHRGFSHSILFFILFSPLLGWAIKSMERRTNVAWKQATLMAFLCLFTHALLDAFTTWGTQLLWPLDHRIAWQTIFVVDPLYTLPFLFCLIAAMRQPRTSERRRKWNRMGLIISTSYLMLTVVLQQIAIGKFEKALQMSDIPYESIIVKPAPLTTILWNANVKVAKGYLLADYSFFDSSPIKYDFYPRRAELLGDMANSETVRRLIKISEEWYVITKRDQKIYFNDLRFGTMNNDVNNPEFVFSYELIDDGSTVTAREVEKGSREAGEILSRLFRRIAGN